MRACAPGAAPLRLALKRPARPAGASPPDPGWLLPFPVQLVDEHMRVKVADLNLR